MNVLRYGRADTSEPSTLNQCSQLFTTRFSFPSPHILNPLHLNPGMLLLKSPLSDEGFRIKRYGNDSNHHHAYHVDSGDEGGSNHRVLAAILYLNDVQVGGETHLLQQGLSVKPKCGRLLLFPCAFTHLHAGARPVSGPKYDVVNFITVPL